MSIKMNFPGYRWWTCPANPQAATHVHRHTHHPAGCRRAAARGYLGQIVAHAMQEGLREDGRALSLRRALPNADKGHIPCRRRRGRSARLGARRGGLPDVTRAARTATMLTAQRPGTIARMEWAEVDLDAVEWVIPGPEMKMKQAHVVPLSRQAVETLRGMLRYSTGRQFVFPCAVPAENPASTPRDIEQRLAQDGIPRQTRDARLSQHVSHNDARAPGYRRRCTRGSTCARQERCNPASLRSRRVCGTQGSDAGMGGLLGQPARRSKRHSVARRYL